MIGQGMEYVRNMPAPHTLADFFRSVLEGIGRLVRCDLANCHQVRPRGLRILWTAVPRVAREIEALLPRLQRWDHQHPLIHYFRTTQDRWAQRLSDVVEMAEWHRLELYQEFFQPLGLEHHVGLTFPAPPNHVTLVEFIRGERDFSLEERELLSLLRLHLVAKYRETSARLNAMHLLKQGKERLAVNVGRITVVEDARVASFSPGAEVLARKYFSFPLTTGAMLPPPLRSWIQASSSATPYSTSAGSTDDPLVVEVAHGTVAAWIEGADATGARQLILTAIDQVPLLASGVDLSSSLTRRETEILARVVEGMNTAAIAEQLCISRRTVEKHLERIYDKLGVQNRTEAVRVWLTGL